jgi:hypothetical protein
MRNTYIRFYNDFEHPSTNAIKDIKSVMVICRFTIYSITVRFRNRRFTGFYYTLLSNNRRLITFTWESYYKNISLFPHIYDGDKRGLSIDIK